MPITLHQIPYEVKDLVRLVEAGSIVSPKPEGGYSSSHWWASRYICFLLLLNRISPPIFLLETEDAKTLILIDGGQRLETMRLFYQGEFPEEDGAGFRPFTLVGSVEKCQGRSYATLNKDARSTLDHRAVPVVVIKQALLQAGERRLTPEEIKQALDHGDLMPAKMQVLIDLLQSAGIAFEPGLSDAELEAVEQKYQLSFPPDLRAFLQTTLPVSKGFPNWRSGPEEQVRAMLECPLEGICFDIEHSGFWMSAWGVRPPTLDEAFAVARQKVGEGPKLIPVYEHRYIPASPSVAGNPIFSVWQTDIIILGQELCSYVILEINKFLLESFSPHDVRFIPLWSEIVAQEETLRIPEGFQRVE